MYTFLATLVLLLGVSAAIILRSIMLRRRHRRMVEEAIANGTWVATAPGTGAGGRGRVGRARVDLGKKPKMYEAWLGPGAGVAAGAAEKAGGGDVRDEKEIPHMDMGEGDEWETIKPFSAEYLTSPPGASSVAAATEQGVQGGVAAAEVPPPRMSFLRRLGGYLASTHVQTSPLPEPPEPPPAATPPRQEEAADDGPTRVRVSVIIAMPSPPNLNPHPNSQGTTTTATHSHATGHALSPSPSSPVSPLSPSSSANPQSPHPRADDEPPLPHIEFGVADLIVASPSRASSIRHGHAHGKKMSVGSSMGGSSVRSVELGELRGLDARVRAGEGVGDGTGPGGV